MWITMWKTDFRKRSDVDNFVDNLESYPQFQKWDCG